MTALRSNGNLESPRHPAGAFVVQGAGAKYPREVAADTTSYSKGQVNRAARLMVEFAAVASTDIDDVDLFDKFDIDTIREADLTLSWWRSLHAAPLGAVNANLRYYLRELSLPVNVTQRLKRRPTIMDKLVREPTMQLTQMGDIGGCRAILASVDEIYYVSRRLRKNWDVERTRDYIKTPKASGYRAIHHIVKRKGCRIEVQLRTPARTCGPTGWRKTAADSV
jgi:putative GTP pyrophosphokinase